MSEKTLYLCYFWINEPLVQTQVLPYLREIRKGGTEVSLLTFERDVLTKEQIAETKKQLADEGIEWNFLRYHKTPSVPATVFDILNGAFFVWKKLRRSKIDILHARVHVPALMGALARKFSFSGKTKLIFDIRGFFPEEYTDAGNWKENGAIYKTVKRVEKWLFKVSDGFIVLTEKARMILFPESLETGFDKFGRPVEVVPCCVNLQRFAAANENSRRQIRQQFNLENRQVITYVGSLGTWYLADEMADLMEAAHKLDETTFAMILTQSPPEIMAEKLKKRGFTENDFLVKKVLHSEIPEYLSAADAAISFIKPCYSKLSSSPTKIAEYLAGGLPIITNRGVGDVAEQVEADNVGVVVEEFNAESYNNALLKLHNLAKDTDIKERCRESAKKRFDLEAIGGEKYRRFYKRLKALKN
jgi:glycosyltransferase involved in cell wall biosynthesis